MAIIKDDGQTSLFPLKATQCYPANLGADCKQICTADDGCDYAIKDGKDNHETPHCEWFCTSLGEKLHLAAPNFKVIEMPDGSQVFGSRWEGGVVNPQDSWWQKVRSGQIRLADISHTLSKIYAYDLFIHNTDRKVENFLVREQKHGHAVLAFDYSCAWLYQDFPLPPLPLKQTSRTVNMQRELAGQIGSYLDNKVAAAFLEQIRKIDAKTVTEIIDGHPQAWLSSARRRAILNWWGSKAFNDRIDSIVNGMTNGSYL